LEVRREVIGKGLFGLVARQSTLEGCSPRLGGLDRRSGCGGDEEDEEDRRGRTNENIESTVTQADFRNCGRVVSAPRLMGAIQIEVDGFSGEKALIFVPALREPKWETRSKTIQSGQD
jgi:hypothetical protein